jgi:hypothetical protein
VKECLDRFHDTAAKFSENWSQKIYIAPCFLGALNVMRLIKNWTGNVAGFVDNAPSSPRAAALSEAAKLNVYKIDAIDGGRILLFSKHSGAIAAQFNSLGLTEGKDYIRTGLL